MLDRMDEAIEIGLPDLDARKRMVRLYFDKLIVRGVDAGDDKPAKSFFAGLFGWGAERPVEVREVTDADLDAVAAATEGLSGREISKLIAAVQAAARGSTMAACTRVMLEEVAASKIAEHAAKVHWAK